MKKIISLLLVLLTLTGCSGQKVTVDLLQTATTKQDLAKKINCDYQDLKYIIENLGNIYKTLPDENEGKIGEVKYDHKGHIMISKEEMKSYITVIDLTTDNWKDIFETRIEEHEEKNSFGELINTYRYAKFAPKKEYIYDEYNSFALKLHDDVNGIDCVYDDGGINISLRINGNTDLQYRDEFPENAIYYDYYDENWQRYSYLFDINNFSCTQAIGKLYLLNIPEKYMYEDDMGNKEALYYYEDGYSGISEDAWSIEYLLDNDQ